MHILSAVGRRFFISSFLFFARRRRRKKKKIKGLLTGEKWQQKSTQTIFSPLERLLRSPIVVLMRETCLFFLSIYLTGYKFRLISYFVNGVRKKNYNNNNSVRYECLKKE